VKSGQTTYYDYVLGLDAGVAGSEKIGLSTGNGSGSYGDAWSTSTLTLGQWYHVVGTFENGATKIYVNGSLEGATTVGYSSLGTSTKNLEIGNNLVNLQYFNGSIDDVAIWSRALAADEIRYLGSGSGNTVATFESTYATYGGTSGNWDTDARWRAGIEPTASYNAHIDSGATVTVSASGEVCNNLYLGDASGESGTLSITGGTLTANGTEYVGYSGSGTSCAITQTGGANTASTLNIGQGTYNLNGGTLNISGNVENGTGTGYLSINGSGVLNLNGANSSIGTSGNALDYFIVGNTSAASFELKSGKSINVATESVGNVSIGSTFAQTGGTNQTGVLYIGNGAGSGGTYDHSAGTANVTGYLYIGNNAGATGTYNLSGTGVLDATGAVCEIVGRSGTGTFTQTGGTNQSTILGVAQYGGSNGTYNQSGGTATFSGYAIIGNLADATGEYNLSGTGVLTTPIESVGNYGIGTFTQTGGTNTVSSMLYIGRYAGSSGTYNLNGGTLNANNISLGEGSSVLNFYGGTLNLNGTMDSYSSVDLGSIMGTLKGSGTLSNVSFTIGEDGFHSPGNSPGNQQVSGGTEEWAGGGTYIWQLLNATGTVGTDWDLISLIDSATLDITASSEDPFNIYIEGLISIGPDVVGNPSGFDLYSDYSWKILDGVDGTITGFDADKFAFSISGIGGVSASNFSVSLTDNNIMLNYNCTVPEPGCAFGLLLGFFVPGFRRLFKRCRAQRAKCRA
jgi:hypothetical protein